VYKDTFFEASILIVCLAGHKLLRECQTPSSSSNLRLKTKRFDIGACVDGASGHRKVITKLSVGYPHGNASFIVARLEVSGTARLAMIPQPMHCAVQCSIFLNRDDS
jgi:hypothetical protein